MAFKVKINVLLLLAKRDGRYIAGALNLIGSDCLYGRYWGCTEEVPFLHFELCYHQAIEWAIEPRSLAPFGSVCRALIRQAAS